MIATMIANILGLLAFFINAGLVHADKAPDANVNMAKQSCYSEGQSWDHLGTWDEILKELQISGVMRVHEIPAGNHVSDNIPIGGHCYIYEIGVTKGTANPTVAIYNKALEIVYACPKGGKQNIRFTGSDGAVTAEGWVRGDPNYNNDCSDNDWKW